VGSNSIGNDSGKNALRLPWPVVTLTLASITIAAVGVLIFVVAVNGADVLATVALALAILSFTAQLIFTAAQAYSANEQYRQMNRLYEESRSVLKKIRTQSDALLTNQRDQFNKVLDHVLSPSAIQNAVGAVDPGEEREADSTEKTEPDANGAGEQVGPSAEDMSRRVEEISRRLKAEAQRALSADPSSATSSSGALPMPDNRTMQEFPSEDEVARVAPDWAKLSTEAKDVIRRQATMILSNPRAPIRFKTLVIKPIDEVPESWKELAQAGFIELVPGRRQGKDTTYRHLLPRATTAIRFFTGNGPVPPYLRTLLTEP